MMSGEYPKVSFGEAIRDCTGGNVKIQRRNYQSQGTLPVIDQGQDFIAGYVSDNGSAYRGKLPVVLFGDHTRCFKYVDFPFALGADGVKVLEPQQGFNTEFLHYFLRSIRLPSAGYSRHFKFLREVCVPKPPLDEQHHIVDILSRADGIVRLRREAQKKATELIPAIFLNMFGNPATNPKGWLIVPFKQFGDCRLGKMLDKKNQSGQFQMPYLRNVNVQWDRIDTFDLLEMDFRPEERETFRLQPGDVLICEGGEIGRSAIWDGQIKGCYYQKALHRLRPEIKNTRPDFVVWMLWHLAHSGALTGATTHATIAHLTGVQLKNLRVISPPVEMQKEFECQVAHCHSIQSQQNSATQKAEATFEALLARTFEESCGVAMVQSNLLMV